MRKRAGSGPARQAARRLCTRPVAPRRSRHRPPRSLRTHRAAAGPDAAGARLAHGVGQQQGHRVRVSEDLTGVKFPVIRPSGSESGSQQGVHRCESLPSSAHDLPSASFRQPRDADVEGASLRQRRRALLVPLGGVHQPRRDEFQSLEERLDLAAGAQPQRDRALLEPGLDPPPPLRVLVDRPVRKQQVTAQGGDPSPRCTRQRRVRVVGQEVPDRKQGQGDGPVEVQYPGGAFQEGLRPTHIRVEVLGGTFRGAGQQRFRVRQDARGYRCRCRGTG